MSLSGVIKELKKSEIMVAKINSNVVGFRTKVYNTDTRKFEYYDFDKAVVGGSQELKDYINNNVKSFRVIPLRLNNGMYMSDEEINGQISVQNFKDTSQAVKIIGKVVKIKELGDQI